MNYVDEACSSFFFASCGTLRKSSEKQLNQQLFDISRNWPIQFSELISFEQETEPFPKLEDLIQSIFQFYLIFYYLVLFISNQNSEVQTILLKIKALLNKVYAKHGFKINSISAVFNQFFHQKAKQTNFSHSLIQKIRLIKRIIHQPRLRINFGQLTDQILLLRMNKVIKSIKSFLDIQKCYQLQYIQYYQNALEKVQLLKKIMEQSQIKVNKISPLGKIWAGFRADSISRRTKSLQFASDTGHHYAIQVPNFNLVSVYKDFSPHFKHFQNFLKLIEIIQIFNGLFLNTLKCTIFFSNKCNQILIQISFFFLFFFLSLMIQNPQLHILFIFIFDRFYQIQTGQIIQLIIDLFCWE